MSKFKISYEGCDNLRIAIVEQAAQDYLSLKKHLWVGYLPERIEEYLTDKLESCIRFFRSEDYELMCSIDGDRLLSMLDEEFERRVTEEGEKWKDDYVRNMMKKFKY